MNVSLVMIALAVAAHVAAPPADSEPIRCGSRDRPLVALTFDACPAPRVNGVIDLLKKTRTPVTIFASGAWIRRHDTEARVLGKMPWIELENHSWSHPDFRKLDAARMREEITRTESSITAITGKRSTYFRFPSGFWNRRSLAAARELGVTAVLWDVVSGDADPGVSSRTIAQRVLDGARNGSIVVMHLNGRCRHTADALPLIVDGLEARGFHLVLLRDLPRSRFRAPLTDRAVSPCSTASAASRLPPRRSFHATISQAIALA